MRSLNIALISAEDPWMTRTGYLLLTQQLISMLRNRHDLNLIVLNRDQKTGHETDGIVLNSRPAKGKRFSQALSVFSRKSMVVHQTNFAGCRESLSAHLNALRPDIVIFNHIRSAWLLPELERIHAKKIYLAHNAEAVTAYSVADMQPFGLTRWLLRHEARKVYNLEHRILHAADAVVTLTNEDADRLRMAAPRARYSVIPPFVDFHPMPERPADDELLLLGSFRWLPKRMNAVWLATKVMPLVRSRFPNAVLRIVGTEADRLSGSLKSCPGVSLHSNVPSVDEYYARAAVFVVPERQAGGIKLKTLEAASFGKAIVSTPEGIEGTGLTHERSCMIGDTAEEFARHIMCFLGNSYLRRTSGENARARVMTHFAHEAIESQYELLLQTLIHAPSRVARPQTLLQKVLLAES